ncbi:MAG: A24 family peptidase [Enhydrobacter sp.]
MTGALIEEFMVTLSDTITLYVLIALFALAIGSFLNVLIYRLPLMLRADWLKEYAELTHNKTFKIDQTNDVNLFWPRSACPDCKTPIPAHHNIPLLSYFLLHGHCRFCNNKIHWRYPFVELVTCLLSLAAFATFGINWTFLFSVGFISLIIPAMMIDMKHQILPDSLTLGLLWLGLIANTNALFTTLPNAVLSAAGAYLSLWLFIQLFYLLTKKIGMGHGDFKLFAAFGAWFGWTPLPLILFLASLIGAIYGLIWLKLTHQNKDTAIPFGPFLGIAGLIVLFFGHAITAMIYNFPI